jgi:hypothetical protein
MANYFSIPSNIPLSPRQTNAGFIYGYDNLTRVKDANGRWNPDNFNRIDQFGNKVTLSQEIDKAFANSELQYITCLGYPAPQPINSDTVIMLVCTTALTADDQTQINAIIANHKANICTNWCVRMNDGTLLEVEGLPQVFSSQETAQQVVDNYPPDSDPMAIEVVGVVVL